MALIPYVETPDRAISVIAGADIDATETARDFFDGYQPSSPSIGFLRDGKLVQIFERKDLEGRPPLVIAQALVVAFNVHCTKTGAASN
jgi:putative YphP/YqiW family bacilliredoxin